MNSRWLIKMAQWARNPPSTGRVKLVFGVTIICIFLVLTERMVGWPDWLTVNGKWKP